MQIRISQHRLARAAAAGVAALLCGWTGVRADELPVAPSAGAAATIQGALSSGGPLGVGEAIDEALARNPQVHAARRAVQAAQSRIRPAGALADPKVELSVSDLGMDGGGQKAEMMLSQMIEWPGKRPLMREEMRAMAGMSVQEVAELELELAARVREAYWDLHLVRENVELARRTREILSDFAQIAEARYAVGAGIQQDVLRAQAEVHKLEARLAEFRQQERVRIAALNVLLGRPASEPLQIVLSDSMVPPPPSDAATLVAEALAARPALRALALEVHRQEVLTSLARKGTLPDVELRAGVMRVGGSDVPAGASLSSSAAADDPAMAQMPGDVAFSAGVMMSIPLWKGSKQDEQVAEARYEREAAAARLEAARLEVGYEVQSLVEEAVRLREQIRVYDSEVLPRDRQAVDSALESYQVGSADFLTLLTSQIATLDDELELHRLHSIYNRTLARLDRAVGRRLPVLDPSKEN